jgi:hypothetical protein
VAGFAPSPKFHSHDVISPVDKSVKIIFSSMLA